MSFTQLVFIPVLYVARIDGRRPVYLAGLPLLICGSLGVGFARNVPELMIWRFIQAFGSSPGLSVGAGVIGDIYRLEERGTAMGIFFSVSVVASSCLNGRVGLDSSGGHKMLLLHDISTYTSIRLFDVV